MCRLNMNPYDYESEFSGATPRPIPQLEWAIPVHITDLGASLEAYHNVSAAINTLRLCHRFRPGSLSTVPQEILEQMIDEVRHSERDQIHSRWQDQHACFQGRCTLAHHYPPGDPATEALWREFCADGGLEEEDDGQSSPPLHPANYTAEEKSEMLGEILGHSDELWDDMHDAAISRWLEQTCLCEDEPKSPAGAFVRLNSVLKSHFGLEALIFHEGLGSALNCFLPDLDVTHSQHSFHTACYLVLSPDACSNSAMQTKSHQGCFASDGDHRVYRQAIDPSSWAISESQRQQFGRALRILGLHPAFHMTELQSLITPSLKYSALKEICACSRSDCHSSKEIPKTEKVKKLSQFLATKDQELATQLWPQLMCLAASSVVSPNSHPRWW